MINFGFFFGFLLGHPGRRHHQRIHQWWLLPLLGIIVGYVTNLRRDEHDLPAGRGAKLPRPIKIHGLFMKRQDEVAEVYAKIVADDIVNLKNIGDELLQGPRSDRTRKLIETAMRPALDRAIGPMRSAVRVAVGRPPVRHDPRVGRDARRSTTR